MRISMVVVIFLLASCSKRGKDCTPPPISVLFRIVSPSGADLLDPSNTGSYDTSNIKMYSSASSFEYKLNVISNITADSFFIASLVYENWQNPSQHFLKFPNGDIDTITTTQKMISNNDCAVYEIISLRYNGIVSTRNTVINTEYGPAHGYTIVK